jgi:hypothetical protein
VTDASAGCHRLTAEAAAGCGMHPGGLPEGSCIRQEGLSALDTRQCGRQDVRGLYVHKQRSGPTQGVGGWRGLADTDGSILVVVVAVQPTWGPGQAADCLAGHGEAHMRSEGVLKPASR